MAKINRFNGNLQAPASAAIGTERTLFGEVTQSDELTDQFTADLLRGWGIVGPSDEPTLQDFNAMGFTLGQLHAYLHQVGVAEYNAAQEYHEGSFTNSGGILYVSLVNNNVGNTPASSPVQWQPYGVGEDFLNTPIATVAAASTIDLTAGAPNTSQLEITGTGVSVNAFTVSADRFFVVRFLGSITLVNSASLNTRFGENIITVAGDSCLLYATADDTVEVISYTTIKRKVRGTAIATTSGTSHAITGLPSWVNKITIMFDGVSVNGTSIPQIQIGSGGFEATGYLGSTAVSIPAGSTAQVYSSGFLINATAATAANTYHGSIELNRITGNTWAVSGTIGLSDTARTNMLGGTKTISGVLDRFRLITVNGTDLFDAGQFNYVYED